MKSSFDLIFDFIRHSHPETSSILKETKFTSDLKLDSLETIDLINYIEENLDIEIKNSDLASIITIGDLVELLETKYIKNEKR